MYQWGRAVAVLTTVVVTALGATAVSASPLAQSSPGLTGPVEASGTPVDIATGLKVPWSILRLKDANDTVLVSERNTGVIERVTAVGGLDPLATIAGVHNIPGGEGGLLGLATLVDGGTRWIYAYMSTTSDNRIVRMVYTDPGDPADATLGPPQVILSGLKVGSNHNGGRIAFGPDGMLYATVGDTNRRDTPQDKHSLNGKILRMTPTGGVPPDNPFPGSRVYSLGHRNPQGLAWDADGQLWESELGQHTWDEFNKIVPGGNYGWPIVEGRSNDHRFLNPWLQWHTSDASPSGLAYIDGTFFMASLRGSKVWTIHVDKAAGKAWALPVYTNTLGRIRDVTAGPGDTLWILTNNTARGVIHHTGDDRIAQVDLVTAASVDGTIDCATCAVPGAVQLTVSLQRRVGGSWVAFQAMHPDSAGAFSFPAVWAGNYRVIARDTGGDGYLSYVSGTITVPKGVAQHLGTIRLRGSQLDRDLSGDGRNDLLAVTAGGALVRYDGTGASGFGTEQTVAATWDATATAQVGDFDGDGTADVVSRDADGALWLHPGDGAGGLLPQVAIAPGSANQTLLIGPGDWNGDGRPDLITRDTSGRLWLRAGNGQDPLSAPKQIGTGWNGLTVIPAGDVTGDFRADLVARTSSGAVRIYPGTGTGGFHSAIQIATGWSVFTALVGAGDVSADGHGDVVTRAANGSLRIYRGTGKGIKSPPLVVSGDWSAVTFAS